MHCYYLQHTSQLITRSISHTILGGHSSQLHLDSTLDDVRKLHNNVLGHGTSLLAKVSLGTLGHLRVQHGGVYSKSNTSRNEEGKGKLLAAAGGGASSEGGTSSRGNNFFSLAILPSLEVADEIAHERLVTDLVVVLS